MEDDVFENLDKLKDIKSVKAKELIDENAISSLLGNETIKNLSKAEKDGILMVNYNDIENNPEIKLNIGDKLHNYFFIGNTF